VTALRLVALTGADGALLAIPMITACVFALWLQVRDPVLLAGSALGGLAIHGSLVYWAFYLFHDNGRYVGIALLALEIAAVVALLVSHGVVVIRPVGALAVPAVAALVFYAVRPVIRTRAWRHEDASGSRELALH
jgi:hypothetical protein